MNRARGPRRIDELVVQSLLDIVNDVLFVLGDVNSEQAKPGSGLHRDRGIFADGRAQIHVDQTQQAIARIDRHW